MTSLPQAVAAQERRLLTTLAAWSAVSTLGGLVLLAGGRRLRAGPGGGRAAVLTGLGRQAIAWGLVDAGIAAVGAGRAGGPEPDDAAAAGRARRMARVTGVNAVLDVGYIAGGALLARRGARRVGAGSGAGDGLGVVVQGAVLLWLDARHARRFLAHSRRWTDEAAPGRA